MVAKRRIFIWVPKHYEKKLEIASKSHLLRGGYPTCKLAKAENPLIIKSQSPSRKIWSALKRVRSAREETQRTSRSHRLPSKFKSLELLLKSATRRNSYTGTASMRLQSAAPRPPRHAPLPIPLRPRPPALMFARPAMCSMYPIWLCCLGVRRTCASGMRRRRAAPGYVVGGRGRDL